MLHQTQLAVCKLMWVHVLVAALVTPTGCQCSCREEIQVIQIKNVIVNVHRISRKVAKQCINVHYLYANSRMVLILQLGAM